MRLAVTPAEEVTAVTEHMVDGGSGVEESRTKDSESLRVNVEELEDDENSGFDEIR